MGLEKIRETGIRMMRSGSWCESIQSFNLEATERTRVRPEKYLSKSLLFCRAYEFSRHGLILTKKADHETRTGSLTAAIQWGRKVFGSH